MRVARAERESGRAGKAGVAAFVSSAVAVVVVEDVGMAIDGVVSTKMIQRISSTSIAMSTQTLLTCSLPYLMCCQQPLSPMAWVVMIPTFLCEKGKVVLRSDSMRCCGAVKVRERT